MQSQTSGRSRTLRLAVLSIAIVVGYLSTHIIGKTERHSHFAQSQSSATFDFGRVRAGEVVEHTFSIPNAGPAKIEVSNYQSTCGCTVAGLNEKTIRPGESVAMPVTLDTAGKSGDVVQPIIVELSNGTFLTFTLRGFVTGSDLPAIEFGTVLRGARPHKDVQLPSPPEIQLEVLETRYDNQKLDVQWSTEGDGARLTIGILPGVPFGRVTEQVAIRTNDPIFPERTLRVSAIIPFPVECEPAQITLGLLKPGETSGGRTRVFSPYNKPVRIEHIKLHEGLPVTWEEKHLSETEIDLVVRLRADKEQSYYKSVLRITANSGGESRTFDIEVYGVGTAIGMATS